jgi:hypothetical protein
VKPAAVLLGDPVMVTITVRHRRGVSASLPLQLELGKFSELAREESTRELGKKGEIPEVERTFKLRVAAYELGELTLPAIEVACLGPSGELLSLTTTPIPIQVRGVLRNEPNPKPKGLEPPVSIFQRTYWLLYLLLGIAGAGMVAALTLIISRRLRARREALRPPPPPPPAHLVALARLGRLDLDGLLARGEIKELYLLLSEIVRDYLGRRWGFDALEMTTTEIRERLTAQHVPLAARFESFLSTCDLVKFAKYRPEDPAARQSFAEAGARGGGAPGRRGPPPPPPHPPPPPGGPPPPRPPPPPRRDRPPRR